MAAMLKVYNDDVPSSFHPEALSDLAKKYKNNLELELTEKTEGLDKPPI